MRCASQPRIPVSVVVGKQLTMTTDMVLKPYGSNRGCPRDINKVEFPSPMLPSGIATADRFVHTQSLSASAVSGSPELRKHPGAGLVT